MKQHYPTLNKDNRKKLAMTFLSLLLVLFTIPTTAFAVSPNTALPVPETVVEEVEEELTPVGDPFTPEGNLTLVDDIFTNNEGDKQFITAVSKNGNWFYLVVDRAGDNNNVYLLNMVDEADLISLMSGEDVTLDYLTEEEEPEPEPEPIPEPEPVEEETETEQESSLIPLIGLGLLGGGAAFYFLKVKPSQVPKGNPMFDDMDEEEEDEEEEERDD